MNKRSLLYAGTCKGKELRKKMLEATKQSWDEMLSKAWEEIEHARNRTENTMQTNQLFR